MCEHVHILRSCFCRIYIIGFMSSVIYTVGVVCTELRSARSTGEVPGDQECVSDVSRQQDPCSVRRKQAHSVQ